MSAKSTKQSGTVAKEPEPKEEAVTDTEQLAHAKQDGGGAPERAWEPPIGYTAQSEMDADQINENKMAEERVLRLIDSLAKKSHYDPRWIAVARTHIEQGFMALNRAVAKPGRVHIPGDAAYKG